MKKRTAALAFATTLALGLAGTAMVAGAAGNAGLNSMIIANPVEGWPQSQSGSQASAVDLAKQMKATYTGKIATAAKEWDSTTDPTNSEFVNVSLTAYLDPPRSIHKQLLASLKSYARIACPGISGHPALSTGAVPSIRGALLATCRKAQGFSNPADVVLFAKANVYGVVVVDSTTPSEAVRIAQMQYAELSSSYFRSGS